MTVGVPLCGTALLFATETEAAPLLGALGHRRVVAAGTPVFMAGDLLIAISGMGLAAAAGTVGYLAERWSVRRVVNLGVAGALTDALGVGDVIEIDRTLGPRHHDRPLTLRVPAMPHPEIERRARLLSRDAPVFDRELRACLAQFADAVDMEGHAVASACHRLALECRVFKVISDDACDRATLLANVDRASMRLARFVTAHLDSLKIRSFS